MEDRWPLVRGSWCFRGAICALAVALGAVVLSEVVDRCATGDGLRRTGPIAPELVDVPKMQHLRVATRSPSHIIFVNPASFGVTPIWYRFDLERGTWTWTPYASAGEDDWMTVETDRVQTGFWAGDKPAQKNLEIIEYLRDGKRRGRCRTRSELLLRA